MLQILKSFSKNIFILILSLLIGNYLIDFGMQHQKDRYLEIQTNLLHEKYKTNYKYFKIMSQDIFTIYEENPKVIDIIVQAKNADALEKSVLRNKLYKQLKKRYKRLKNMGVMQIQFHLVDNESFLRMNNPNKFGDNLTNIRETINYTNLTKLKSEALEIGKTTHGFRFLYPLFDANLIHIGSMEISFSSEKLINSILEKSMIATHFLLSREEIENKLSYEMKKVLYSDSLESKDYLLELKTDNYLSNKHSHEHILNNVLVDNVSVQMAQGSFFSISNTYNYETTVGSFVPIKNLTKSKTVAYLVVYIESDYLDVLDIEKKSLKILFFTILFLLFLFSLYVSRNREKLHQMAHYDKLTNLPNRAYFYIELEQEINRAKRYDNKLAVMFIDLDGFKAVNDTYGHDIGDSLLVDVSRRIEKTVRAVDVVARMGGDEFTVVLPDIKDSADALLVAEKIIAKLNQDFVLNKKIINIGASIGVSIFPDYAQDSDSLIKQSDSAMYIAKEKGKNLAIMYKEDTL